MIVNGIMNRASRQALRRFQLQQGLPVDGIAGPDTERALKDLRSAKPLEGKSAASRELEMLTEEFEDEVLDELGWQGETRRSRRYIKWVQASLNGILGTQLALDGRIGPLTRSAVRSFQKRRGLVPDGIVGPITEAALVIVGAVAPPRLVTPPNSSNKKCRIQGKIIKCDNCTALEKRVHSPIPKKLVEIDNNLKFYRKRTLQLTPEAADAFKDMVEAARLDGIKAPYLKIISAYRSYQKQTNLWNTRLVRKFRSFGCNEIALKRIAQAAKKTSLALKHMPIPHGRDTWLNRFRVELEHLGPVPKCGMDDPIGLAVRNLRKGTAPPGRSPHHSGRAIDIHVGGGISLADAPIQRKSSAFHWLVCNASRFGFHPLRNEPWHWEYTNPSQFKSVDPLRRS